MVNPDNRFALVWGELATVSAASVSGDLTDTGTVSAATVSLVDLLTGTEIDSRSLAVRDDDPEAEAKITSEPAFQEVEDRLLRAHDINREEVDIVTAW